jgi:outer membrane protein OmpA-like peptidoglycan-associated protein
MDFGPLTEILQSGEEIRRNVLDQLGPLAPILTGILQIVTFGVAAVALIAGKGLWAPPTPTLSNFPARIVGLAAGVGVVALYVWSKNGGNALNFLFVSFWAVGAGLVAAILYLIVWLSFCFKCDPDPAVYVRGFRLTAMAKRVLAGDPTVPPQYKPVGHAPTTAVDYFCNCGPVLRESVWESRVGPQAILTLVYILFMVPLTVGIAAAAISLSQPQYTVNSNVISLPDDVLFEFGKADMRPGAVITLQDAAKIIRQRSVTAARIEGHTDAIGTFEANKKLSQQRADAVRAWLTGPGGLDNVKFTTVALGASESVAPDTHPDGTDNPEGRAKNRRVTIVLGNSS